MITTAELYEIYLANPSVNTDTRTVREGDIFFALKGPSFDGNKYAADALKKGASYAVIDNPEFKISDRYLVTDDVLSTLQKLARHHRDRLNIPFIAIAGSNGKTTTKELMKEVLKTSYETFHTPGNFNNQIGVPLSIFMIPKGTEMAVIEMGARQIGDIKELCEICNPTHGLITNNGKDHMETFGTLENTLKTNAELYDHLAQTDGVAFVNIAHQDLMRVASKVKNIITYGNTKIADYAGMIEELFPYLKVSYTADGERVYIDSQLIGKYNFENIMAAVAIGKHMQVNDRLIKKAIEGYAPTNNRSQLLKNASNTYILDAYNANPSSMAEALDNFIQVKADKKVAILGDMLELGETSYEEHLLLVLQLGKTGFDHVVLVGPEFGKVKDKMDCVHFDTSAEAKEWFAAQGFQDTLFLLKGSRGIAVEKVLGEIYK